MSIGVWTWPGDTAVDRDPVRPERPRQAAGHAGDAALGRGVGHGAAEAAGPPALRAESDDPAALALLDHRVAGRTAQEERRLEVDVVLEVPVVLGHLVQAAPATQHGGQVGQHVQVAELVAGPRDERGVARQVAQVGGHGRRGRCPRSRPRPPRVRAWSRSTAITLAPVAENACATALPMPPAAPVTMTPLPSRPAPTLQVIASALRRSPDPARQTSARTFSLRYRSTTSSMTSMPRPGLVGG